MTLEELARATAAKIDDDIMTSRTTAAHEFRAMIEARVLEALKRAIKARETLN